MGLIKAAAGSAGGVFADTWKEYFYCDALGSDTLAVKGHKRTGRRSSNRKGSDNIITTGSVIAVADGQCMLIVEQGKVVEVCAEPGEFVYDASTEPSIFCGNLGMGLAGTFESIGRRFTFGGEAPKDQRIYYLNTKEITGVKYGTANPVPFRVVDKNVGLDVDIAIKCFGEYSFHIADPILFYTNVCGNVSEEYTVMKISNQMRSELQTALQPAFAKISDMGVRYSALPGHTAELADALNEVLSRKWRELRGIEIVSFGVSSVKAGEEDEAMIKELQRNAAFKDPTMAAAHLVGAQAEAMQSAASNQSAGPMMAFAGMNMAAANGGMNAQNLYAMGQANAQKDTWTCPSCGKTVSGKFCPECGAKRPETDVRGWTCLNCGAVNKGKFCAECGTKKPAGAPLYKCDKCGWEPENPAHPPKFCPECGDPFGEEDIVGQHGGA